MTVPPNATDRVERALAYLDEVMSDPTASTSERAAAARDGRAAANLPDATTETDRVVRLKVTAVPSEHQPDPEPDWLRDTPIPEEPTVPPEIQQELDDAAAALRADEFGHSLAEMSQNDEGTVAGAFVLPTV